MTHQVEIRRARKQSLGGHGGGGEIALLNQLEHFERCVLAPAGDPAFQVTQQLREDAHLPMMSPSVVPACHRLIIVAAYPTALHIRSAPGSFGLASRVRACSLHAGISLLVAAGTAALVLLVWYPRPFDEISGGRELLTLLITVDVIVGPLITLAIWNVRKPRSELLRDVGMIGLIQLAALAYGVHTAADARPAVVALEGARLAVVRPIDLDKADLERAPPSLRTLSWLGPRWVAAREPTSAERLEAIDRAMQGQDVSKRPEFWRPESDRGPAFANAALPLDKLQRAHPKNVTDLQHAVERSGRPRDQLGYLPIRARRTDWSALVDLKDGAIVGYMPIDGF